MNRLLLRPGRQKGASLILVLVLLSVMLIGAGAIARKTEIATLVSGATAAKDTALQASELGVSLAIAAVSSSTSLSSAASWYSPVKLSDSVDGLPANVAWDATPSTAVGGYTVRYYVERLCSTAAVSDYASQCAIRNTYSGNSAKAGTEQLESNPSVQYRTTVRTTGPKGTNSFVQALFTN